MTPAAPHAFQASRPLPGANRYYGGPAVVLEPLGPAAADGATHGRWMAHVLSMCGALGWPGALPRVHAHAAGVWLAFAAPALALRTAAEVNQWAWERAAAGHDRHADAGYALAQPASEEAREHFRAREAGERSRPFAELIGAADERGLPWVADGDTLTLGEGAGSVGYPRAALPLPMDVPWPRLHGVPKVLVSGSAGKDVTTRLLAAMAAAAGLTPGSCTSQGVQVAGATVDGTGDAVGARAVLRHPSVTVALLETSCEGIVHAGLAVREASVAVVTDIDVGELGRHGIDSAGELAQAQLTLAHAVHRSGWLVLDGTHEVLLRAAVHLPHAVQAKWALFARDADAPVLAALRQRGGSTCGTRAGRLELDLGGATHDLGALADMPALAGGEAAPRVEQLAAAALTAALLEWPLEALRAALRGP